MNNTTQTNTGLVVSPFDFDYSITPHLTKMRASIKATKYAVSEVAVIGKHTLMVAKASAGKSTIVLKGVCEQITQVKYPVIRLFT